MIEGLQAADDGEQFEPLAAGGRFVVGGLGGRFAGGGAKDEAPALGLTIVSIGSQSGFRVEQEVRGGYAHRRRLALVRGKG